jgi:hypothetical protein
MTPLDGTGLVAAFVIGALLIRASLVVPLRYAFDDGRIATYVANFRQSLRDAGSSRPVLDGTVPDWVMADWMAPLNRTHDFALLFKPGPQFTDGLGGAVVIDGTGRLSGVGIGPINGR